MVENMSRFVSYYLQSQDIAIVFDQHADLDALAAATSLCLALQEAENPLGSLHQRYPHLILV